MPTDNTDQAWVFSVGLCTPLPCPVPEHPWLKGEAAKPVCPETSEGDCYQTEGSVAKMQGLSEVVVLHNPRKTQTQTHTYS